MPRLRLQVGTNLSRIFFLLVVGMLGLGSHAQTAFSLARNENLAEQAVAQVLLQEIYKKAGFSATVAPLPPARATIETLEGLRDGEVARIFSYGTKHPELLRVTPAYYYLTTAAFAKTSSKVLINNPADLRKYSLGVIRGVQHSMDASDGLPNVQAVSNADSLFGMLKVDRFEVALDTGINGQFILQRPEFQDISEKSVVATAPLFHYLNPKYKSQAEALGMVIKTLTESGELAKLTRQAERDFLAGNKSR
jgi:hypothetical protein